MTRIAILADIHANPFALEAIIDDLPAQRVDEVVVAGDLVGRGPMGAAVVSRVRALGWPCVRGNHEDYLINFARRLVPEPWLTSEHWAASRWMAHELGQDHVEYIEALPFDLTLPCAPSMLIVHGSPRSNQEGIGPWTTPQELEDLFALVEPERDLIICAHTHRAVVLEVPDRGQIVNVGSVGLPFNGDWRAQYAILERLGGAWRVELRQLPYDRDALTRAYHDSGFLHSGGVTSAMLLREVLHARPFLVPFLHWAKTLEREPTLEHIPDFLQLYDAQTSTREFMAQLDALKTTPP